MASNQAYALLGFEQVIGALKARANTEGAKDALDSLPLADTVTEAQNALDETGAMIRLVATRPDFDIEPCEGPHILLKKAQKSTTLTGQEIRLFAPILKNATRLGVIFSSEEIDESHPLWEDIPAVHGLAELIDESIDDEGRVRPNATPKIESLTKSVNSLGQSIKKRAEALLKDKGIAPMLQDDYVTLRDNRYVLPIKAEEKSHLDGIIHDASNTGQTFFIEPKELVDINNRLRTAQIELDREIARLLAQLSAMIAGETPAIIEIYDILVRLDLIYAKARLSVDLDCTRPIFSDEVALINFSNPVMLIEGKKVVRNNMEMGKNVKALIISGPNTGGKTVALKSIGLIALMARIGLYITADDNSRIPFYEKVYADIGDRQSIEDELSTFSAHLMATNEIVREARPGCLILLDELMVSTDPNEGAALAVAMLDYLVDKGVHVIVTTHFRELKVLAQSQPEYHNVSMEFDKKSALPTYRMLDGAPGASSALEVAAKLGLAEEIILAARVRLEGGDERIEEALEALRAQKQEIESARREAKKNMERAHELKAEAEKIRNELDEKKEEMARTAKQKLSADIASARQSIADMVEETRLANADIDTAKAAMDKLNVMAQEAKEASAPRERIGVENLAKGDEVYITRLERKGVLANDPVDGKVELQLGSMRMTVGLDEIVGVKKGGGEAINVNILAPQAKHNRTDSASMEVDLRGMRVEEAIDLLIKQLDELAKTRVERARIIHGKGTGALKEAVRGYLATAPYAKTFSTAAQNEGGDGVTIVWLR